MARDTRRPRRSARIVAVVGAAWIVVGWMPGARAQEGTVSEYTPTIPIGGGFEDALDMVLGPDGNLWLPEPAGVGNHVGRLGRDGTLTTIPIDGKVGPDTRMVVGPDGAIWFTGWDGADAEIDRIDPTAVPTFERIALPPSSNPGGLAVGPDGYLWIAMPGSNQIARLDPTTRALTLFANPTTAGQPLAIGADPQGRGLWISMAHTDHMILMGTNGQLVAELGAGMWVTDIVAGPDNNVWLAGDAGVGRINADRTVTLFRIVPYGAAGIAFDTRGRIWVASQSGQDATIARVDPSTGAVDRFNIPSLFGAPNAVALGPDDQMWVIESRFATDRAGSGVTHETLARVLTGAPIRQTVAAVAPAAPPKKKSRVFITIERPSDALAVDNVAWAAAIVAGLYIFLVLPASIFNSTLEANYERVIKWPLIRRLSRRAGKLKTIEQGWRGLFVFVPIAAAIYTVPSAIEQGLHVVPIVFEGLVAGLVIPVAVTAYIADRRLRREDGEGATIRCHPGALAAAIVFALVTAVAGFDALFTYGVIVSWQARGAREPTETDRSLVIARTAIAISIAAIVSWVALQWQPPRPLSAVLEAIFLVAVEFLLLGLLPLRFLPGDELKEWKPIGSRLRLGLWILGALLFVLAIIGPGLDSFKVSSLVALIVVAGLFGAVALVFWFAMRPESKPEDEEAPPPPDPAEYAHASGVDE